MVYNVNEDQCATTPILKGLYVWDGSKWQFVGQKPSSDVGYEIDNRPHGGPLAGTTQIYPYLILVVLVLGCWRICAISRLMPA